MARKLPLKDPHWLSMKAAIEQHERQTGSLARAVLDLERDMTSGELRSMRQDSLTDARELLEPSFWGDRLIDVAIIGAPAIYPCKPGDKDDLQRWSFFAHHHDRDDGLFYVWRPDFDRLYSGGARGDDDDSEPLQPMARPQRNPKQRERKGRRPALTPEQQEWLREKYGLDAKANPLLMSDKRAIPHVQGLAKEEFRINAPGRTILLKQIIRPVRRELRGLMFQPKK